MRVHREVTLPFEAEEKGEYEVRERESKVRRILVLLVARIINNPR